MHRAIDLAAAHPLIQTANELVCPHCDRSLVICQHRDRFVFRLDEVVHQICRDKRCPDEECVGHGRLYRPLVDLRLALPRMSFGLDVVVAVGEGHLGQGRSLSELGRELTERGVPIHQTHVGRLLRNFLALCKMERGDEEKLRRALVAQGGMVLMVDGVHFDDRSPVLYMCWDAVSGIPLFGERMEGRGAKEVGGLLRRVKRMGVPVLGIVTDAEKGLVPAVQQVFPEVPHQLCHTHFLKNCARPMESDLRLLSQSIGERAERVRELSKRLDKGQRPLPPRAAPQGSPLAPASSPAPPAPAQSLGAAVPGPPSAPASSPAPPAPAQSLGAAVPGPPSAPASSPAPPAPAQSLGAAVPGPPSAPASSPAPPAPAQSLGAAVPGPPSAPASSPAPPAPAQSLSAAVPGPPPAPASPLPPPPVVEMAPLATAPSAGMQAQVQERNATPVSEEELVRQLCALVKLNARASGKAPLNPPELVRHQRLEEIRQIVEEAQKKRPEEFALAQRPRRRPAS